MKIPVGDRFHEEARRHALRFCCESCAHFDPGALEAGAAEERGRCAHGYPTEEHRRRERFTLVIFCKEYELQ